MYNFFSFINFNVDSIKVAGSTGRHLKEKTHRQLPRLIALDPASKQSVEIHWIRSTGGLLIKSCTSF